MHSNLRKRGFVNNTFVKDFEKDRHHNYAPSLPPTHTHHTHTHSHTHSHTHTPSHTLTHTHTHSHTHAHTQTHIHTHTHTHTHSLTHEAPPAARVTPPPRCHSIHQSDGWLELWEFRFLRILFENLKKKDIV